MRVLVTGASGFLGQHLCHALTKRGASVVGLVRDLGRDLFNIDNHTVIGSYEQVERAIAEYEIEAVVHLAAQTQVSTAVKDPIGTWEANVAGTWRVLEACRRQDVKRVVVASSDKVYGNAEELPYIESHPILAGEGVYATSKACADLIAQSYAVEFDLSVAITRCGNLYGPGHTNWSTLIPGTIRSVLRGERPRLRSNGSPERDYLHVSDAVDGYLRLLDAERLISVPTIYNFGCGLGWSALEVVAEIQRVAGTALDIEMPRDEQVVDKPIEIQSQFLDASMARRDLGWKPKYTLRTGLVNTVEWYRDYLGAK